MIIKLLKKIIPILSVILLCMTFSINTYTVVAVPSQLPAIEGDNTDDIQNFLEEDNTEDIELTLEKNREKLATFAEKFAKDKGNLCTYTRIHNVYDSSDEGVRARAATYQLDPEESNGPFLFDCVGWVSYAIHWALHISYSGAETGKSGFVTNNGVRDTSHFVKLKDLNSAKRGDILYYRREDTEERKNSGHVAIYLGTDESGQQMIVDCTQKVKIRTMSNWQPGGQDAPFQNAATLCSLDGANFGELPGSIEISDSTGSEGSTGSGESQGGTSGDLSVDEVDLDDIINRMEYDGMPPDVTFNGGHSLMYYIDKIGEALDYLIGIMFNGIKVAIVAVIDGVQTIITNALEFLSGTNSNST